MKHRYLFVFLFALFTGTVSAQWTEVASMPGPGRNHAVSFVIGDTAYVTTGSFWQDFHKYHIPSDTWHSAPDFAGVGRSYAVGFEANGKGYVTMGFAATNNILDDMWEYDPATGEWTQKTSCPCDGRLHPGAAVINNKAYITMGQNANDLKDMWEYDPATDTWTQMTDFIGTERHHPAGSASGGIYYIGTGHQGPVMFNDWYAYDPVADTWTVKADLPVVERVAATAVTINDMVYYVMGENEFTLARFDDVLQYNPTTDSWLALPDFPADGRWAPTVFTDGAYLYAGQGQDNPGTDRSDMWRFDLNWLSTQEYHRGELKLYPNPTQNHLTLEGIQSVTEVEIYDAVGRLVVATQTDAAGRIDVQAVAPGAYHLVAVELGLTGFFVKE